MILEALVNYINAKFSNKLNNTFYCLALDNIICVYSSMTRVGCIYFGHMPFLIADNQIGLKLDDPDLLPKIEQYIIGLNMV